MNCKEWTILSWNIRGINGKDKWVEVRKKIEESGCSIICLQETKREEVDSSFIQNFCPRRFNKFLFLPSHGRSGGLLIIWNGSLFDGQLSFSNAYFLIVEFTCLSSHKQWLLTNIYGSCQDNLRTEFLEWLNQIDMPEEHNWMVIGDFNYLRSTDDRNKPGGNINDMLRFNEAISQLGWIELQDLFSTTLTSPLWKNHLLMKKLTWWSKTFHPTDPLDLMDSILASLRNAGPLSRMIFMISVNNSMNASSLSYINTCFIALIPKIDSADKVNDFRPISLLNCTLKLITRLLANILQAIIMQLIDHDQYGFIKTRTIQDCLAWAFEYIHACHKTKEETILLKLDFEKAFDKVEYKAIIHIMQAMGFGAKWCQWITNILHSASSQILLNGVPGKMIHCKRGVRKGDPFSPLLFVIVADLLQTALNEAMHQGQLERPINSSACPDFPIVQYADDTLIIMKADENQIQILQDILQQFHASTGIKVNFQKSSLTPLNMTAERGQQFANLACQVGTLPFTYLGLPLGTTRPKIEEFMPMIKRIENGLSCFSSMLSYEENCS